MLLTFHTDFSNEENGTAMFYKGFLAYYQAIGEWSPGCLLSGLSHREWGPEKGNLESKEVGKLALIFPLKKAFFQKRPVSLGPVPHGQFPKSIRETHRSR